MISSLASTFRSIDMSSDVVRLVIAAIDFGTYSSGYAFTFQERTPDSVQSLYLNNWQIGSTSSFTRKTPTTVLLRPDKTFDCFGYAAEDKYAKLCDTYKHKGWWYFQKFKMLLYQTKNLSRDVVIEDAENKTMPAIEVFSIAIAFLKESILSDVRRQNGDVIDDDVLYVITVPAIWSDAAKQFMREAAVSPQVGIKTDQLKLVIEPEAASVYCRQTPTDAVRKPGESVRFTSLPVGHKYIVADLGGGTVDIAAHEVIRDGKIHEIHVARGEDQGGHVFNKLFLDFLSELFGKELFHRWQMNEHGDYLTLLRTIEGLKWQIAKNTEEVLFKLDLSLLDVVKEEAEQTIQDIVNASRFTDAVEVVGKGKLVLQNNFLREFFKPIMDGIVKHIRRITEVSRGVNTIFLVGGLAQAPFIQQQISETFPNHRLIVPEDPGVAVLKGAVLLGNKPEIIAGRIARYSYGVRVAVDFVEGMHKEEYQFTREGRVKCDNIFERLIRKGQVLRYGDIFTTTTQITAKLPETKQLKLLTYLYQSIEESPTYCTDEGCIKLACVEEEPPEGGWPEYSEETVQIIVGEAEFKFLVITLDRTYEAKVDFMLQSEGDK